MKLIKEGFEGCCTKTVIVKLWAVFSTRLTSSDVCFHKSCPDYTKQFPDLLFSAP